MTTTLTIGDVIPTQLAPSGISHPLLLKILVALLSEKFWWSDNGDGLDLDKLRYINSTFSPAEIVNVINNLASSESNRRHLQASISLITGMSALCTITLLRIIDVLERYQLSGPTYSISCIVPSNVNPNDLDIYIKTI